MKQLAIIVPIVLALITIPTPEQAAFADRVCPGGNGTCYNTPSSSSDFD